MPTDLESQEYTLLTLALLTLSALAVAFLLYHRERFLRIIAWLARALPGGRRRIWHPHAVAANAEEVPSFPFAWEKALRKNMALYARLTPAEQKQLQDLVIDFVPGREWLGHDGLEVTDEMKATIAGQACVLLLGIKDHDLFASVPSIIVHPRTFSRPGHTLLDSGGIVLEDQVALLGEAWYRGPVLLSWREVLAGGRDADGGSNVVFHEFAHQLDFQGQDLVEALSEEAQMRLRAWAEVMQREFDALVAAARHHKATLLDHYGATDTREFFAVSTECFFEKPIEMQATYPALYEVLRSFYGQDPAERLRAYRARVDRSRHKEQAT